MTRIVGTQTLTSIWDFYDYQEKGWFRRKEVLERELHATKGWKSPRRSKSIERIPFHKTSSPFVQSEFRRWA
jgi:hypothetical protein